MDPGSPKRPHILPDEPTAPLLPDRREQPRHRLPVRVECRPGAAAAVYDIGPGGVFVPTPAPLPPGTELELSLHLPGERRIIRAEGRVVWTNLVDTPSLPAGMGVRFLRIDPADRVRLERRLRALDREGAST